MKNEYRVFHSFFDKHVRVSITQGRALCSRSNLEQWITILDFGTHSRSNREKDYISFGYIANSRNHYIHYLTNK